MKVETLDLLHCVLRDVVHRMLNVASLGTDQEGGVQFLCYLAYMVIYCVLIHLDQPCAL